MNITEITKQAGAHKRRKRVGRGPGSGSGKTSGRGHKGIGARSGGRIRRLTEGGQMPLFRRMPKRGFNNYCFRTEYSIVNLSALDARFQDGATVTTADLIDAGLVRNTRHPVKILGAGKLSKKLSVEADRFSESAIKKIEAAGGSVKQFGVKARAPKPKKPAARSAKKSSSKPGAEDK